MSYEINKNDIVALAYAIGEGTYFEEDLNGPDYISCRYCDSCNQVNYRVHHRNAVNKALTELTHDSDCPTILAKRILKEING